jgi:predicted dithiol-disulfide oxidoreductase (DUF899 family)
MTTFGNLPEVVPPEEWLAARLELLRLEKEVTRARDRLNAERRRLPMVRMDKPYVFEGPDGQVGLLDLFDGRDQLVIHHFMFGPDWDEGCVSCSLTADHFDVPDVHLHQRGISFTAISRAPLAKLNAYKRRMGWKFPWASSYGSDFNYDYGVSFDGPGEYNYRHVEDPFEELPGFSAFALEDGVVYHTYSSYGRGGDVLMPIYQLLDRAPYGRNEDGFEVFPMEWVRRHDEYEEARTGSAA